MEAAGQHTEGRYRPPSLTGIIHRKRLLAHLEKRKNRKLFFIYGKAGQGKSTLAADFLSAIHADFLWYRVQTEDNAPGALLTNLLHGLDLSADGRKPAGGTFADRLNSLDQRDFYIVLDDYHLIASSREIGETISSILENAHPKIHFILISRTYPQFHFYRLRSAREISEIREEKLLFSFEETDEVIRNFYKKHLAREVVEKIHQATEGWIGGVVYLFEYLDELEPADLQDALETFLREMELKSLDYFFRDEVISVFPENLQKTCALCSLFDTVSPETLNLCNGGSGTDHFAVLKSMHTFMSEEGENGKELSFHPLFRSFLRRKFEKLMPDEKNKLHACAAAYYDEKGDAPAAFHHLLSAGKREEAIEKFIEAAEPLLAEHKYESIDSLLQDFYPEEIDSYPILGYYQGIISNLLVPFSSRKKLLSLIPFFQEKGDFSRQIRIYTELLTNYFFYQESDESVRGLLEETESCIKSVKQAVPRETLEIVTVLLNLGRWWVSPEEEESYKLAMRAEETAYKYHNDDALLCSRLVLAKVYLSTGEFSEALRLLLKTEKLFQEKSPSNPYLGLISFFLGDTYFYLGEIDKALDQTRKALRLAPERFAFRQFLRLNLITYYLYTNQPEKGEQIFDSERIGGIGDNLYLQYFYIFLLQLLIAYRNKNTKRTRYYCGRLMEPENRRLLRTDFPSSYLILGEVNIYIGDYGAAEIYLRKVLEESSEAPGNLYSRAGAYALLGYIYFQQGQKRKADHHFNQCCSILTAKGYQNLDICDPGLLKEIAQACGREEFDDFPRLMDSQQAVEPNIREKSFDLHIFTFGTLRIFVKGEEIDPAELNRQKRVMDLLKLLIVFREHGIAKEILYDIFWPRYSYKNARDNLNTLLYRLRKLLGESHEAISSDLSIIRFKPGKIWLDVDDFNTLYKQGKSAEGKNEHQTAIDYYTEAAGLYKGDFLETGLYIDQIRDERENVKNKYRQILLSLSKLNHSVSKFKDALEWAKELISYDPLCEPAYRLYMIASAMTENRIEITRIFEKLNANLREKFEISPDKRTINLKNRLLSGETPPVSSWKNESII